MSFAFKRFNFFQPHQIARHGFPPNASCVVPGGSLLWVGTESGSVCILDTRMSLIGSFNAHGQKVQEVLWLERRQLLVTVGVEEPGCSSTTVKLWAADRLVTAATAAAEGGTSSGGPGPGAGATSPAGLAAAMTALKVTKVFGSHGGVQYPESPVTAAAAAEGGGASGSATTPPLTPSTSLEVTSSSTSATAANPLTPTSSITLTVALGLASGHVVVLTGEVGAQGAGSAPPRARLSHSRRLSARPDSGDLWSVTGLELTGTSDLLSLFVVTESQTLCFHLQTNTKTILDPQGSPAPHCCCLRPGGALLTVARTEGLYDYTADTRAGCTVFEGAKQRLGTFGRYLVVVTRDDVAPSPSAPTNLLSAGPGLGAPPGGLSSSGGPLVAPSSGSSTLLLADVRTKLLAGSFLVAGGIAHVFVAWGAVHAVTALGAVWSYREVDLGTQLEALLRRSLHKLAVDVARSWGPGAADAATLSNIHTRWGDHLYSKGEYDAAMSQYLETVGQLEPSYVIRRFLDAQRIHNLTSYLEVLHERGLATCDHTTLLLNCYTKLKDVSKLDAFIRRGGVGATPAGTPTGQDTHPTSTGTTTTGGAGGGSAGGGGGGGMTGPGPGATRGKWQHRRHLISAAAVAAAETGREAQGARGSSGRQAGRGADAASPTGPPALLFDADTAVRVLRGAGYAEHALAVADAAGQIDAVLDLLLDEIGDGEEAITYLEQLPRRRRADALKKYGKSLISMCPEEATRLIMDLCCPPQPQAQPPSQPTTHHTGSGISGGGAGGGTANDFYPLPSASSAAALPPTPYISSVSDFAHLYSGEPTALMLLCEFILNTHAAAVGPGEGPGAMTPERVSLERLLYHTLLELYLAEKLWEEQQAPAVAVKGAPASTSAPIPTSSSISSISSGSKRPTSATPTSADSTASAGPAGVGGGAPRDPDMDARRTKVLELLARGWPPHVSLPDPSDVPPSSSAHPYPGPAYDPDHALVLCRLHSYRPGLLFLYDRLKLPREVLQVYMACGDYEGLIAAVIKHGDAARGGDPALWSEVLEWFVTQHDSNPPESDCSGQIMRVIEHVERSGVLPPLVVLKTLARSRRLPLSLVRGYIARALQRDMAVIAEDREAVTKLAAETSALRDEVTRLRTQPRVFQNSRCSASGAPLELPVVHFLCGHSYNLRQLGEGDRECPLCGPDQRRVAEIRRNMQAASLQPERFFAELHAAADGFGVVAAHFGRGLLNVTPAMAAAAAAAAAGTGALAGGGQLGGSAL